MGRDTFKLEFISSIEVYSFRVAESRRKADLSVSMMAQLQTQWTEMPTSDLLRAP